MDNFYSQCCWNMRHLAIVIFSGMVLLAYFPLPAQNDDSCACIAGIDFYNPPVATTIDCEDIPPDPTPLYYTNNVFNSGTVVYRINTGGVGVPGWDDDAFLSPSPFLLAGGGETFSQNPVFNTTHPSIPPGTPTDIFKSERWDPSGGDEMQWEFPVTIGDRYEVRLYFAEIFGDAFSNNKRVFDVAIEGAVPADFDNIDQFALAGAYGGLMLSFVYTAGDAVLDIDFLHLIENPAVKGIEILNISSAPECAISGYVYSTFSFDANAGCLGEYTESWSYTDLCSRMISHSRRVIVSDNTQPSPRTPPDDITVQCAADIPPPVNLSTYDNCDGYITASPTPEVTPGSCDNNFVMVRTWTFTDRCGNSSTTSQTITVSDDTPPMVGGCPANLTLECDGDFADAIDAWISNAEASITMNSSDNCSGISVTNDYSGSIPAAVCGPNGGHPVTFTVTDDCGNAGSCVAYIFITDNTAPEITCPPNLTLECDDMGECITFSEFSTGDIVSMINTGSGPVSVSGVNPTLPAGANAAMIFDSNNPTGDDNDLGTPNQAFGGPGIGIGGGPGKFQNDQAFGNMLIVSTDLNQADPNDHSGGGTKLLFDFSGIGTVTVEHINVMDMDRQVVTGNIKLYGPGMSLLSTINLVKGGDNSVQLVNLGPTAGVQKMVITLDDSGAVDNLCFTTGMPTGFPTASDDCDPNLNFSFIDQIIAGSCPSEKTVLRTWTARDACGNADACLQTITYEDTTAPMAPNPPADLSLQCASDVPAPVALTATDNCDGDITVSPTAQVTPGSCINDFTMVRTWTFTDACGNTSSVSQTIIVLDDTPPVPPAPPADLNLQCASDVPAPVALTATDNCDGDITVSPTAQVTPGSCINDFTMVRTWTFTDTCGNTSSVSQTIIVLDDTPPVPPAPPADLNLQCASDVPAPVALTATDNCDGDITVSPTAQVTPGSCINDFTMVRTWTFTDTCGNTSSVSQTIIVLDDTPPVPPAPPADLNLQCASDVPAPVALTATDNCDGDITVSPTAQVTPGSCINDFTMVRTWTFTDTCGNTSSVSQTIIVLDDTPPVPPAPPADLNLQCASDVPAPVALTATDNCDGDITVSPTAQVTPGSCINDFTMVRTWTFTDTCGNTSSVSQTITVLDDTPPVPPAPPADLNLQCASDVPAPVALTATDNCDGDITVSPTAQITPGSCINDFTMVRVWTFTDNCGNTSSVSQTITVFDDTAPSITCPANLTVECTDSTDPSATGSAIGSDNCGGVTITFSDTSVPGCGNTETITRTWTATDVCGNSSSCVQTIEVVDTQAPVGICPAGLSGLATLEDVPPPDPAGVAALYTDNCGTVSAILFNSWVAGTTCTGFNVYYIYEISDGCNSTFCTVVHSGGNTIPLTGTCPPGDQKLTCMDQVPPPDPDGVAASYTGFGPVTAVLVNTVSIGDNCSGFMVIYEYEVSDNCATIICKVKYEGIDLERPKGICPTGLSNLSCIEDIPAPDPVGVAAAYSDNCSEVTATLINTLDDTDDCLSFSRTYVYRISDACGNSLTCSVTHSGDTQLTGDCPEGLTGLTCIDDAPGPDPDAVAAAFSDGCGGEIMVTLGGTYVTDLGCNGFSVLHTYMVMSECGAMFWCGVTHSGTNCPGACDGEDGGDDGGEEDPDTGGGGGLPGRPLVAPDVSIYPNPTTGEVRLAIDDFEEDKVTVTIYNVLGDAVFLNTIDNVAGIPVTMDLRQLGLANGTYFVSVRSSEHTITRKLILNGI